MADKKISQLTSATTPLAGTEVLPIVQSGSTVKVPVSDLTAGRGVSAASITITNNAFIGGSSSDSSPTLDRGVYLQSTTNNAVIGHSLFVNDGANNRRCSFFLNDTTGEYGVSATASSGIPVFTIKTPFGDVAKVVNDTDLQISTSNLVIGTAGKGIDFSANTHAAGMTSELLDWYEEGTYTVALYDDNAAGNASATTVTGRYTRVGNVVHCNFSGLNGISTAGMTAGNTLYISLPFTPGASGGGTGSFACENFSFGAGRTNVIPAALASQPRAIFRAYGSGTSSASLLVSDVTSGSANIDYFSLTYQV